MSSSVVRKYMICKPTKSASKQKRGEPQDAAGVPRGYLVTFGPLAINANGRQASIEHSIPPFVDGSIRREPDLLHPKPGISCLCRAGRFAPRLRSNDVVVYLTKKGKFGQSIYGNRLVAVLKVIDVLESHKDAEQWYINSDLPLPNNCMVSGNSAMPLSHSHRIHPFDEPLNDKSIHKRWDAAYRLRSIEYPAFVVCDALHVDLSWESKIVPDSVWIEVFGKMPGTLNPAGLPIDKIKSFLKTLGVNVKF